jgi:hypothetical protein
MPDLSKALISSSLVWMAMAAVDSIFFAAGTGDGSDATDAFKGVGIKDNNRSVAIMHSVNFLILNNFF